MEGSPRAVKVLAERSYTASFYERLTGALIRQNDPKINFLSRSPEWKDFKTCSFVGLDGCDLVCRELRLAEKPEGKLGTKHQARKIQETPTFFKESWGGNGIRKFLGFFGCQAGVFRGRAGARRQSGGQYPTG